MIYVILVSFHMLDQEFLGVTNIVTLTTMVPFICVVCFHVNMIIIITVELQRTLETKVACAIVEHTEVLCQLTPDSKGTLASLTS